MNKINVKKLGVHNKCVYFSECGDWVSDGAWLLRKQHILKEAYFATGDTAMDYLGKTCTEHRVVNIEPSLGRCSLSDSVEMFKSRWSYHTSPEIRSVMLQSETKNHRMIMNAVYLETIDPYGEWVWRWNGKHGNPLFACERGSTRIEAVVMQMQDDEQMWLALELETKLRQKAS